MKALVTKIAAVVLAAFVCVECAHAQYNLFPPVTIPGSHIRQLKSAATGRDYDLYIHLPSDYTTATHKRYPVLYVLDGQWDFKLLDSVLGGLVYDKFVPELIIVGITYTGNNVDYNSVRAMDYTPSHVDDVNGSGGGPKFLKFVKTELIPFIESDYREDPTRRILMGSSYGGLFTLCAMLNDPTLFYGYVAASPAVSFDHDFVFKLESDYARAHKDLPARVFISVGDSEGLTNPVKRFMKTLTDRHYKGLVLETRVLEGERHAGNKPEAFNRGLRFVFSH